MLFNTKKYNLVFSLNKMAFVRSVNKPGIIYTSSSFARQIRLNSTLPAEADGEVHVEETIQQKPRAKVNKSRLLPQHRNMLHNELPYGQPHSWIHLTEKYQRTMLGRYGQKSGVDPRICFPTKEDEIKQREYEKFAFPSTVPELVAELAEECKAKQEIINQREIAIAKKLEKLEQWKKELHDKVAKKEADAQAAKEKKERLIEEVRRHFGFKVDSRDERFKELLEQKEKEDKKKQKEAKRKAKEEKLLAKLTKE